MADSKNTRLIPLTQGKFAIVDAEYYSYLTQHKWHFDGRYAVRMQFLGRINGKKKFKKNRMHRTIIQASPGMEVDHINGNGLDNRKSNLRFCSRQQNTHNQKHQKGRASKYKGVNKRKNKWQARIQLPNKKRICLGAFYDEADAAKAYNEAALKYFGEFSRLNIIPQVS